MTQSIRVAFVILLVTLNLPAQNSVTDATKNTTKVFLDQTKTETDSLLSLRHGEIEELKIKIAVIDEELKTNLRSKKEVQKLRERILALEQIKAKEDNIKKKIFLENYNSAFVNLLSMEEDIKPLKLFNSSKNFYSSLKDMSNPTHYEDYQSWLSQYKSFLEKRKSKDVMLEMADEIIERKEVLNTTTLQLGPLGNIILYSIEKFIVSIGSNKRELKEQSVKMFKLLSVLDSFEKDNMIIESKYNELIKELEALEKLYTETKFEFIESIGLDINEMEKLYFQNTDENVRIQYLNNVKEQISQGISHNQFGRDESIHLMNTVQSLKIRFGDLTAALKDNILQYKALLEKYKDEDALDLSGLNASFTTMLANFDENFPSEKYKMQAIKMFRTQ